MKISFASLFVFAKAALGADIAHDWLAGFGGSGQALEASPGDVITFSWTGTHDVKHIVTGEASGCDFTGSQLLSESSPFAYTVPSDKVDGDKIHFACSVGAPNTHCGMGQYLTVTVHDDEDHEDEHDDHDGHDHDDEDHEDEHDDHDGHDHDDSLDAPGSKALASMTATALGFMAVAALAYLDSRTVDFFF